MAFSVPIQHSAPHIYISALPLASTSSPLRIEGLATYKDTLKVTQGLREAYRGLPSALRAHASVVKAVAFSPDGSRFISSSYGEIRIWDAESDQSLEEPLRGHTTWVSTVVSSPNGSQIGSGSDDNTVRLWDAETGQISGNPSEDIRAASMPSNSYVKARKSSRAWATTQFEYGMRSQSTHSDDCTIRLWNAQTGQWLGEPLLGHTHHVKAVSFSPNGLRVVSSSDDCTIRQWDMETGQLLGQTYPTESGRNQGRDMLIRRLSDPVCVPEYDD
ncbi:Uncharacterized WD repeat-containing protein alr3466 [Serendipita indica DSM 11827]|nr:Uncharacterized WD repeat-containing protein alr3466 [Serendipita indica DSM 11827]